MPSSRSVLVAMAVVALLLVGCGNSKVPDEGPVTVSQLKSILPNVVCDRVAECECPLDKRGGSDRSHCKASVNLYLDDIFSGEGDGREFDGDRAWECLDAAERADCSDAAWVPLCDRVLRPTREVGASCTNDLDCIGFWEEEAHCDVNDMCASGPRDFRGELGDGCTFTKSPDGIGTGTENPQGDATCALSDGLTCEQGQCVQVAEEGQACDTVFDCALGTYCSADGCVPNIALGDECPDVINFACGFGNFCGEDGLCTEQESAGAECTSSEECEQYNCTPLGTCGSPGQQTVCEHFGYIEVGD